MYNLIISVATNSILSKITFLDSSVYLIASLFGVGNIPSDRLNLNPTGKEIELIPNLAKSIG